MLKMGKEERDLLATVDKLMVMHASEKEIPYFFHAHGHACLRKKIIALFSMLTESRPCMLDKKN